MSDEPRISEAEWIVMKVVWAEGAATANKIVEQLAQTQPWKPKTIRTLIGRLAAKGIVTYNKVGREYVYRPAVSEDACLREETRSFLQRAGAAALTPILAAFIEEQTLSAEEIEELKAILDKKGGE